MGDGGEERIVNNEGRIKRVGAWGGVVREYSGASLIRNCPPPPQDHHRRPGISLLEGPGGRRFLMDEVPLYMMQHVRKFRDRHAC